MVAIIQKYKLRKIEEVEYSLVLKVDHQYHKQKYLLLT